MSATVAGPGPAERARLGRRAQLLAGASVTYNVVEVSSGLIVLWQFRHRLPETRERHALRLMSIAFLVLAGYVTVESVRGLSGGEHAAPSPVGIGLAVASLVIMPMLSVAQRRTGRALGPATVVADSTQTLLCTYLSAVLLAGLALTATLRWSWADPVAGLVIAAVAAREGIQAWQGKGCCAPAGRDADGCGCGCMDSCCEAVAPQLLQVDAGREGP